jgi:Flp pilus assembly protein CpaB
MNYDQRRGRISVPYLLTVGIAALVAVGLAAHQVSRATSTRMLVARVAIAPGQRLDAAKLGLASMAKSAIPAGALLDANAVIGRYAQRPIAAGSAITPADLSPTAKIPWLADASPAGRVVITLSVPGTLLPVQQLRMGDQLEVLAVSREGRSRVVGRDAYLIGSMQSKAETRTGGLQTLVASASGRRAAGGGVIGLVLAVRPEDVSPIAQAEAARDQITFAVHGRSEIESGHLLDVAPRAAPRASVPPRKQGPAEVELIAGSQRGKVSVP